MFMNEGRREEVIAVESKRVTIDCSLRCLDTQAARSQGDKAPRHGSHHHSPFHLHRHLPSLSLRHFYLSSIFPIYLDLPKSHPHSLCLAVPLHIHTLYLSLPPHPSLAQLIMSSQRYQRVSPPADLDESHNHDPNPSRFFFGCASLKPDTDRDRGTGECPRRRRSTCPPVESVPSKSHTFLSTPLVPLSLLLSFIKTASSRCFSQQE